MAVLSHYQAAPLLAAYRAGQTTAAISPDLNLTTVEVRLTAEGALFPSGERLAWAQVEAISRDELGCYLVEGVGGDDAVRPIRVYSEITNRYYSLMPTALAPTMLISGIPMHRVKDTDPYHDTLTKIRAAGPLNGRVLDTATGLGYTAIEAAKTASEVITIELDPAAHDIARLNPWSRDLFANPRITRIIGDSYEVIEDFKDGSFVCIIHDPPTFSLAGDLYSLAFYRQAFRVLRRGGRMFHYIGNPESRTGAGVTRGVKQRLREAGFARVVPRPEAFGVVAYK